MDQNIVFLFIVIVLVLVIIFLKRRTVSEWWRKHRHPKAWVTLIKPHNIIEVKRLYLVNNDKETYVFEWEHQDRHFVIDKDAKFWAWKLSKKYLQTPIIDYEAGRSVNLLFDPKLYMTLSNPILSGQLTDAVMIKEAFGIRPSMRKKIIFAIVFFLLGFILFGGIIRGIIAHV